MEGYNKEESFEEIKKRGRGRPKKGELELEEYDQDKKLIDVPMEGLKVDLKMLCEWTKLRIKSMRDDRNEWSDKRLRYMPEFENLVRDNKKSIDGIWEGSANFHVPLTMWMLKQMHSRLLEALIGDGYGFVTKEVERTDMSTIRDVDATMRWAIKQYANNYKGIDLTIDDWVWDICKEGWGVLKKRWCTQKKKIVLTTEELETLNRSRTADSLLNSLTQIVTSFDGPVIETVAHESILFPGECQDPGDLDEHELVSVLVKMSKQDLLDRVKYKGWDKKAVDKILAGGSGERSSGSEEVDDATRLKNAAQGTLSSFDSNKPCHEYYVHECYASLDVDDDGYVEDLVYFYSEKADVVTSWTTLDRVAPKVLKRPLYKADFLKRTRRTYSIGMAELLFSPQREVDAMHNQRIDFGTIGSIPFFFYKPLSGLKKQRITIAPMTGIPVNNPTTDVYFPKINTNTQFSANEENLVVNYAEKTASLPAITTGQSPAMIGPAAHATGFQGLLNQVGVDFEPILRRSKKPYEMMLKAMHADMQLRMPEGLKFRILGSHGQKYIDDQGNPINSFKTDRSKIQGDWDFSIIATSKTMNKEVMKQDAQMTMQTVMNPILVQSGIVTMDNLYWATHNYLRARDCEDIDILLTKPATAEKPLSLLNEIVIITQGEMPKILLNDNHEEKIVGLTNHMNSEAFKMSFSRGYAAMNSPELFEQAIAKHKQMNESIKAQAAMQNDAGMQVSPTLGARLSGEVNQQTGRSLAEESLRQGGMSGSRTGQ